MWATQPEVIGWRIWAVSSPTGVPIVPTRRNLRDHWEADMLLSPLWASAVWPIGEPLEAVCEQWHHQPPGRQCGCGIWATRGNPTVAGHVLGLVRLWGTIAIHGTEGWRGQFAQPVALFGGVEMPYHRADKATIQRVANNYGIPLIDLRNPLWPAAARELGAPSIDWLEERMEVR